MKAETFDRKFDSGKSIIADIDIDKATRPRLKTRRVNIDFPDWMVDKLDKEAKRLDVTRQSVIKVWLSERLEHITAAR